jgi:hypothetical protein
MNELAEANIYIYIYIFKRQDKTIKGKGKERKGKKLYYAVGVFDLCAGGVMLAATSGGVAT